jgi:hypothetical protein
MSVFNLLVLTLIIIDFFFNTDTYGIIAFGALPMSLSKFFPQGATAPNFSKFPFAHDFVLDGSPKTFARSNSGHLIPCKGQEILTSYGVGTIERVEVGGSLIVAISEFDETVEVPQYGRTNEKGEYIPTSEVTHYITPSAMVARLSRAYNNRIEQDCAFVERIYGTGKAALEKIENLLNRAIGDNCYEISIQGGDYCGATEFIFGAARVPESSRKVSRAELRAERKRLRALADRMLQDDHDDMPDEIAAEIADELGYGDEPETFDVVENQSFDFDD